MLKSLLQALFGRPEPPTSGGNLSHEWRRAPERTWNSDLLEEVPVSLTVTTGHHGFLKVVGESHYQGALRSLEDRLGREAVFEARLVPEPDNPTTMRPWRSPITRMVQCVRGDRVLRQVGGSG